MLHSTTHFSPPFSFLHRSAFRPNREFLFAKFREFPSWVWASICLSLGTSMK